MSAQNQETQCSYMQFSWIRLRIGCSTTELPRLGGEIYISIRGKLLSILRAGRVPALACCPMRLLARKRVHGPSDPYPEQQKQQQRPNNILNALQRAPPAEETKRDRYHQRKEQHRLKVAQMKFHLGLSLPPARGFISMQGGQQIEDACSREKPCAIVAIGV